MDVVSDDFSCPVCLQILYEPVSFACKHKFCTPCVRVLLRAAHRSAHIAKVSGEDSTVRLNCPVCRAEVSEDELWKDELLSDLLRRNFNEEYIEREEDEKLHREESVGRKQWTKESVAVRRDLRALEIQKQYDRKAKTQLQTNIERANSERGQFRDEVSFLLKKVRSLKNSPPNRSCEGRGGFPPRSQFSKESSTGSGRDYGKDSEFLHSFAAGLDDEIMKFRKLREALKDQRSGYRSHSFSFSPREREYDEVETTSSSPSDGEAKLWSEEYGHIRNRSSSERMLEVSSRRANNDRLSSFLRSYETRVNNGYRKNTNEARRNAY